MLWNRKFAIEIQIENTVKKYESSSIDNTSLPVEFSVTKTIGGIGEEAEVTISGLSLEDINYLCTSMVLLDGKVPPRNYVQISAGFPDDYGVIFKGGIYNVIPNVDISDMSVILSCLCNYYDNIKEVFKQCYYYVSYLNVVQDIASFFNIPYECSTPLATSTVLNNPSFNCTGLQAISQLRGYALGKIDVFISGGVLYMMDSRLSLGSPIRLAGDTGLIGTPKPTPTGAIIKSILRPSLQAGKLVAVESKKLMMTSGLYRIINLSHKGSSRGDEFYSEITGMKINSSAPVTEPPAEVGLYQV